MSNVTEAAERLRRVNANIAAGTAGQISSVYGLETVASYETDKALLVEAMLAELSTAPITADLLKANGFLHTNADDEPTEDYDDYSYQPEFVRGGIQLIEIDPGEWDFFSRTSRVDINVERLATMGELKTLISLHDQMALRLSRTSTHEGGGV